MYMYIYACMYVHMCVYNIVSVVERDVCPCQLLWDGQEWRKVGRVYPAISKKPFLIFL